MSDRLPIIVRKYDPKDLETLLELFKDAVFRINIRHYSEEQVKVWAEVDIKKWRQTLESHHTFVAEMDKVIVGFADLAPDGLIDHLYIHPDYQGRFIYLHLLRAMEKRAQELGLKKLFTHCSITAKIPALRAGFRVVKEQQVKKAGIYFTNFLMEKDL